MTNKDWIFIALCLVLVIIIIVYVYQIETAKLNIVNLCINNIKRMCICNG